MSIKKEVLDIRKIKKSLLLITMAFFLVSCGGGSVPPKVAEKPSEKPPTEPTGVLEWEYGETVPLQFSGRQAKDLVTTLSQNLGLNANQFEDLSINLEIQSLSVLNPNNQQYFQGELSIGWIADGEFQEIRARAEENMMTEAREECSGRFLWKRCTLIFEESNEQKRDSFGKGNAVRLMFEILDEWAADYHRLGGAFIFYGHERGDDGTMEGSIHYLPRHCPGGGAHIDGRFVPCAPKSLNKHCWLLQAGPYQCATTTLKPPAGRSTYQVHHCMKGEFRGKNEQRRYVCERHISRSYTKIGSFQNFDMTNANDDHYGSISTSDSSRSLASVGEQKPIQKWILYLLYLTFFSTLVVAFIGYSKAGSKK